MLSKQSTRFEAFLLSYLRMVLIYRVFFCDCRPLKVSDYIVNPIKKVTQVSELSYWLTLTGDSHKKKPCKILLV